MGRPKKKRARTTTMALAVDEVVMIKLNQIARRNGTSAAVVARTIVEDALFEPRVKHGDDALASFSEWWREVLERDAERERERK